MSQNGYGNRAELAELVGLWAVTIFFDNGFKTYLIPVDEFSIEEGIDAKKLEKKKPKKPKEK